MSSPQESPKEKRQRTDPARPGFLDSEGPLRCRPIFLILNPSSEPRLRLFVSRTILLSQTQQDIQSLIEIQPQKMER